MKWKLILSILVFPTFGFCQNGAMAFDGIDDYIDLGTAVATDVRTIELWIKPESDITPALSEFQAIVNREAQGLNVQEFYLAFVPSYVSGGAGKLRFRYYVDENSTNFVDSDASSWDAGRWYHIAGVIDPVMGMMLFIDGVKQQDTHSFNLALSPNSYSTSLGSWGGISNRYFAGEMDDVRFSTTARYTSDFTPPCPSLTVDSETQALYSFDADNGSITYDSGSNGFDGTVNGSQWTNSFICTAKIEENAGSIIDFELFPNPTREGVRMIYDNPSIFLHVEIIDLNGSVVQILSDYRAEELIFVDGLDSGIYLVKVTGGNGVSGIRKLIIE